MITAKCQKLESSSKNPLIIAEITQSKKDQKDKNKNEIYSNKKRV